MNRRIVITGIGVISSIGIGKDEFWTSLLEGRSGISEITSFDTSTLPVHYGGEVRQFRPDDFLTRSQINSMGRASQMAVSAAQLAIKDSGINLDKVILEKAGVIVGTTMGESQVLAKLDKAWVEKGEEFIDSGLILQYPSDNISNQVAKSVNFKGDNLLIPTACASGNYAIGYAVDLLRAGRTDLMLAGGADPFSQSAFIGFNRLSAMSSKKCAPFDKNREGMILGEGAAIVVLEALDTAQKRGANIYAEVLGYGLSCDAYYITAPQFGGIISAILLALRDADIKTGEVDYISAHGTGTVANDKTECMALKKIFGEHLKNIPVSSIKSMLGHCMGAASALEAIACALAVSHDCIPPTINYETIDPECEIDCVPNKFRKHRVDVALNNAFAFGGNNACLVLRKFNA